MEMRFRGVNDAVCSSSAHPSTPPTPPAPLQMEELPIAAALCDMHRGFRSLAQLCTPSPFRSLPAPPDFFVGSVMLQCKLLLRFYFLPCSHVFCFCAVLTRTRSP